MCYCCFSFSQCYVYLVGIWSVIVTFPGKFWHEDFLSFPYVYSKCLLESLVARFSGGEKNQATRRCSANDNFSAKSFSNWASSFRLFMVSLFVYAYSKTWQPGFLGDKKKP